jgi:hypothetical protein
MIPDPEFTPQTWSDEQLVDRLFLLIATKDLPAKLAPGIALLHQRLDGVIGEMLHRLKRNPRCPKCNLEKPVNTCLCASCARGGTP